MSRPHHRSSPLPLVILAYAATVLIWGTTWLAIKYSLRGFGPLTGVGLRFTLAAFVLAGIGMLAGAFRGRDRAALRVPVPLVLVLAGCLFGLNYVFTYIAETHLPSGLVAVLFGTLPFFVFGFSALMLGEALSWRTLGGAAGALCGVGVISLAGEGRADLAYCGAAIFASLLSAYANAYLKRWSHIEPFVVLPYAMLLAGLCAAAAGFAVEPFDAAQALAPGPLLAVAYLGVAGSAVSFYLMHWLLQRIDAGIFGLSALMIPIVAVAVGIVFGGEAFTIRDLIGAVLVIGGVWLALTRASHQTRVSAALPEERVIAVLQTERNGK